MAGLPVAAQDANVHPEGAFLVQGSVLLAVLPHPHLRLALLDRHRRIQRDLPFEARKFSSPFRCSRRTTASGQLSPCRSMTAWLIPNGLFTANTVLSGSAWTAMVSSARRVVILNLAAGFSGTSSPSATALSPGAGDATRPTARRISQVVMRTSPQGSNSSDRKVGATASLPPTGSAVDHTRIKLGEGEEVFTKVKAALGRWEQFRLGWVGGVAAGGQPTSMPPTGTSWRRSVGADDQ